MDEKLEQLIAAIDQEVPHKSIPVDAVFYRQIHLSRLDKKRHVPSPSCFEYTPQNEDDGLSVDWAELTTPELSLAILGRTYKLNKDIFKDSTEFGLYRIKGSFLAGLDDPPRLRHAPNFYGNPPPKGKPNNPAHAVVIFKDPDDLELRVKLQNHAEAVPVDRDLVEKITARLSVND